MNSGKIVAGGWTGRDGTSKVLQEVLADLKMSFLRPKVSTDLARYKKEQNIDRSRSNKEKQYPSGVLRTHIIVINAHHLGKVCYSMLSAIFLLPCLLLVGAQHCGPEELDSVGERVTACVIRCLPRV